MQTFFHIFVTWFGITGLAFCIGILVFHSAVYEPLFRWLPTPRVFWPVFILALLVIAATTFADFLFQASEISGRAIESSGKREVLLNNGYGRIRVIRAVSLGLLLIAAAIVMQGARLPAYLLLIPAIFLVWTETATGHAGEEGHSLVQQTMGVFHLLAASVWGGGVLVLGTMILPSYARQGDMSALAEIIRRFSRVAGFAVVVLLVTAVYNIRTYAGSFGALWSTPYGLTMLVKTALLYLLLLVGAFNRYLGLPVLLHLSGSRIEGPGMPGRIIGALFLGFRDIARIPATRVFTKALFIEGVLLLLLFLCAAALKHQTPAAATTDQETAGLHRSRPGDW